MPNYRPRKGATLNTDQIALLAQFLDQHGWSVTPEALVSAARSPRSPIHGLFVWDDKAAAEAHRLQMARKYISDIEVIIEMDGNQEWTRAWHSVTVLDADQEEQRRYVHVSRVLKDAGLCQQVVDRALTEATAWQKRYKKYSRIFGSVFQAIDDTRKKVGKQKVGAK